MSRPRTIARSLDDWTGTRVTMLETFSLADPQHPARLGSLELARGESLFATRFDGTRAYNEKALTVLDDQGLILVPYQGDTTSGWTERVQLIDLGTDTLTARGMIEHGFAPRRATAHRSRVISISGQELLSADVTDRDHPLVKADAEIAWPMNQLFVQGNYLLEIANGGGWLGADPPTVRVAPVLAPDAIANRLELDNLPVVGTTLNSGRLYLLQSPRASYRWPIYWGPIALTASAVSGPGSIAPTNLLMTVVDVSALPAITILGQCVASPGALDHMGGNYQPVWPSPGLLVWFSTGFGSWINPLVDSISAGVLPAAGTTVPVPNFVLGHSAPITLSSQPVATAPASAGSAGAMPLASQLGAARVTSAASGSAPSAVNAQAFLQLPYWRPWWSAGGASLLAFDVSNSDSPTLVSAFNFNPTNAWGFSAPLTAAGLIYFSHEQSDHPARTAGWRLSEYLDVIDYTDPVNPTLRPAVGIPGQLAGLSPDGAVLYLLGTALSKSGTYYANDSEGLNACAYDGVRAYLVASLALPQTWPRPVLVNSGTVYLGRAAAPGKASSALEAWALSAEGQFKRQAVVPVPQPLAALAAFGKLLAAQDQNNAVTLFDITSPAALRSCGHGEPSGCLWYDLNHADGTLDAGLWLSLDDYGVAAVPVTVGAAR